MNQYHVYFNFNINSEEKEYWQSFVLNRSDQGSMIFYTYLYKAVKSIWCACTS